MQGLLATIEQWHIHPVVDHFTVALLVVAVIADLLASVFSTRTWFRYSALALLILGTAAAWGSDVTGGWEAHRVWKIVKAGGGPAADVLRRHAELGHILPWVFLVLVVWRLGVQFLGFIARTRSLYLLVAVLATIVLLYQGYMGGEMVYDYGIGTALLTKEAPSPSAEPSPAPAAKGPATPIPTVFVPAPSPTPQAPATAAGASPGPSPSVTASAGGSATPSVAESATPSPAPSASPKADLSPKPGASPTPASAASRAIDGNTAATPAASGGTTIRPPDPHSGATSL